MKKICLEKFVQDIIWQKIGLYHIEVRQHGEILNAFDFRDRRRENIHSCSKSVTSTAIGIAIDEGLITLDDKPAEIFANKLPDNPDSNLLKITIKDMMMMATGHDYFILQGFDKTGTFPGRNDLTDPDYINYCFSFKVPHTPGTYFKYNNFGPFMASAIIEEKTGERLVDYLRPRLFDPLDIKSPQWEETPLKRTLACGGLTLTCEEMGRLGEVFLDGTYQGKKIVSKEYMNMATSRLIENAHQAEAGDLDAQAGYGLWFWRCHRDNAYSARGWAGQYIICLPEQDAVVSVQSYDFDRQKLFNCIWKNIVPQLKERM